MVLVEIVAVAYFVIIVDNNCFSHAVPTQSRGKSHQQPYGHFHPRQHHHPVVEEGQDSLHELDHSLQGRD